MVVNRFIGSLRAAPPVRRVEAAKLLVDAFLQAQSQALTSQTDSLEAAMTALLDDPDLDVRLALAEALATEKSAPTHIVLALSLDLPPISAAIIKHSHLLLGSELVERIQCGPELVREAAASRASLSEPVVLALVDTASIGTCRMLLRNSGADLTRDCLLRLIDRYGTDPSIRRELLDLEGLPIDIRQRLLTLHAAAMKEIARDHGLFADERVGWLVDDARDKATIALAFQAPISDIPALVDCLIDSGQLTAGLLIRAIASGQVALFCACMAALSDMPADRVSKILASGGEKAQTAMLQKAGLPQETRPVFLTAIELIWRRGTDCSANGPYRQATNLVDSILRDYERWSDNRSDQRSEEVLSLLRSLALDAKRAAARSHLAQLPSAA